MRTWCVWLRQDRTEQWTLTFKGIPVSAVYYPFYLLVTVLREPALPVLSHMVQDELWFAFTSQRIIILCHGNSFRDGFITPSESVACTEPLGLLVKTSLIGSRNVWDKLVLFFWMVCMRTWGLDPDTVREKVGASLCPEMLLRLKLT